MLRRLALIILFTISNKITTATKPYLFEPYTYALLAEKYVNAINYQKPAN